MLSACLGTKVRSGCFIASSLEAIWPIVRRRQLSMKRIVHKRRIKKLIGNLCRQQHFTLACSTKPLTWLLLMLWWPTNLFSTDSSVRANWAANDTIADIGHWLILWLSNVAFGNTLLAFTGIQIIASELILVTLSWRNYVKVTYLVNFQHGCHMPKRLDNMQLSFVQFRAHTKEMT